MIASLDRTDSTQDLQERRSAWIARLENTKMNMEPLYVTIALKIQFLCRVVTI